MLFDGVNGQPGHRQPRRQVARRQINVNKFFDPVVTNLHINSNFEIYDHINGQSLSVQLELRFEKLCQIGKDQLVVNELLDEIAQVRIVVNISRLQRPSLFQTQDVLFGDAFDDEISHMELRAFGDRHVQRDPSFDVVENRLRG